MNKRYGNLYRYIGPVVGTTSLVDKSPEPEILSASRRRFMRGGGVPPPATPSRRSLRSRTARADARRCPCPATRAGRKSSRRNRPAPGGAAAAIAGQAPATGCRSWSRPRAGCPLSGRLPASVARIHRLLHIIHPVNEGLTLSEGCQAALHPVMGEKCRKPAKSAAYIGPRT